MKYIGTTTTGGTGTGRRRTNGGNSGMNGSRIGNGSGGNTAMAGEAVPISQRGQAARRREVLNPQTRSIRAAEGHQARPAPAGHQTLQAAALPATPPKILSIPRRFLGESTKGSFRRI